jgi:TP901 family phage tail tape measure protein
MINIGTLLVMLKLHDQLSPALARASNQLKATGTRMKAMGTSMAATGKSLTMGLTVPLVAMGAAAGIAFGSFEKNMNRVKALTGETGLAFDAMKALAKDLGKTTQFSAREAADAMGFLAMAGFKAEEIIGTLPGVLQLAASAQLDLASAADITTNILTGYGRTVAQVAETNDILVAAFTAANTDLVQLGQAFKFVGPVAKAAGMEFEEATAMLALMGNAGIQSTMAGTALRGALANLMNITPKVNKILFKTGVVTKDAAGELLPMSDIVQQLGERGVSAADMMTIFGKRAGPAMVALVSQGHQAIRDLSGGLREAGGIAERVATIQMEGLSGAFIKFKSAAEGMMIEVGEQLAPMFIAVFDKGVQFSNWISNTLVPAFTKLSPVTQAIIIGLIAFAAALGPLLMILGHVALGIGAVIIALGAYSAKAATATTRTSFLTRAMVALNKTFVARGVKAFFAPAIRALGVAARATAGTISLLIKRIAASTLAQKVAALATWAYVAAKKALMFVVGGGKAIFLKFIAFLGLSTVAQSVATISTFTLAGAFTALWIATGVGLIVLAAAAAAFALFKFTKWIAQVTNLGAAWIRLKGRLGFLTEAEVEAALAARELGKDLEDLEATADELQGALTEAALTGTVEDLTAAWEDMGEELQDDTDIINTLMMGVRRLDADGQELTETFQDLIDEERRLAREAEEATAHIESQRLTMLATNEATEQWAEEVEALRRELSGEGLQKELEQLTEAYVALTPEQMRNKRVMRDVGERLNELAEAGMNLNMAQLILVQSWKDHAAALALNEATAQRAVALQALIDRATQADLPARIGLLEDAWLGVDKSQNISLHTMRFFRDAMNTLSAEGHVFTGVLGDIDFATVELADAQTALTTRTDALILRFSKTALQGKVQDLEIAFTALTTKEDINEEQMIALAKEALALRDAGGDLSTVMDGLADSVDDSTISFKNAEGAWAKISFLANKHIGGLNNIFKAAFEGGGSIKGAIESFATGVLQDLLTMIPVVGEFLSQFAGAFVAAGKKIWGGIKSMFGGPSGAEKEARKLNKVFEDTIIANLNQIQLAEAGGRRWAQVVIGVRDSYIAAGKTSEQASDAVARLWAATKIGPEAVQPIIDEIQNVINTGKEASEALAKITQEAVTGLQGLVIEARQSGELLPAHLEPYLVTLREAGLLTQQDADLLRQMADEAHVDWKAMQTAAEKYGISLEELGPKFDRKRLEDAADAIVADWEILNQEGVNTSAVLEGMSKSVQDLIDDAHNAGVDIPHNMQPIIEQMIDQGLLTDENGKKLTDMGELEFAEPLEAKFSALIDKIDDLIDKLMGDLADAVGDVATEVKGIPQTITIDVGWDIETIHLPHIDPFTIPFEYQNIGDRFGGGGGFQSGTQGKYVDFGTGTPVMLHGKERVMTEAEGRADVRGGSEAAVRDKELLGEMHRLNVEMRNLPRHLRDAILLSQ